MASNREERQLMRQRGAASRKVQQVDFGFSFGSPQLEASAEPPQLSPSSQGPARKNTTPSSRLSRPSIPRSQRTPNRAGTQELRTRTPGSGRSGLSQTSVYDIPPDDEPEQRSPKRRKLSAVSAHQAATIQETARADTEVTRTAPNGLHEPTTNAALNPSPSPVPPTPEEPPAPAKSTSERAPSNEPSPQVPTNDLEQTIDSTSGAREPVVENDLNDKSVTAPQRKRKKRKSVVLGPKRKSIARNTQLQQPAFSPAQDETTALNEVNESPEERSPTLPVLPKQKQPVKRKGRRQKKATPSNVEQALQDQPEPEIEEQPKGRPVGHAPEKASHEVADNANEYQVPETSAEAVESEVEEGPDQRDKEEPSVKRPKGKHKKTTTTQRERPSRRRPSPEETSQDVAQETPGAEEQSEPPASRQQTRRQRKLRGETVPVVVHRLANLGALDIALDEEPSGETGPSASAYRIPSRGGANAADVLNQICRETLEKTMSTLENSISQESNPARRAEWTRKRKAVEAFSTELGHRLFDMSEMMESNFVLTAQVKRERKEMAALRNRLMEVRRERRDIALKIDDVRRRYTEEEQINREQDILNNSLHNLELALERSHKSKKDDSEPNPFVGLEFLLRTVAQDVSSVAPDSRGGLLNQVRSFNAQLERLLEKK